MARIRVPKPSAERTSVSATKNSPLDLINKMAASKPKDKKAAKPEFALPDMAQAAEDYIAHKAAVDTGTALMNAAKDQILAAAVPKRLDLCVQQAAVLPSVSVVAGPHRLTMTVTKKYCAVPEARTEALEEAFGKNFDRFFKGTLAIGLKAESANSGEAFLSELIHLLGEDFFAAHFEAKRDLDVTDAFHNSYTTDAAVQATAAPFIQEQTIRNYAASLKIA